MELSTERFSLLANQNHDFGCFGCFGMCWHRGHPRGASKHQSGHGTVTWRCILQDSLDEETEWNGMKREDTRWKSVDCACVALFCYTLYIWCVGGPMKMIRSRISVGRTIWDLTRSFCTASLLWQLSDRTLQRSTLVRRTKSLRSGSFDLQGIWKHASRCKQIGEDCRVDETGGRLKFMRDAFWSQKVPSSL